MLDSREPAKGNLLIGQAMVLASAGLLWIFSIPLIRETAHAPRTIAMVLVSVLLLRRFDSSWIILGASALEVALASTSVIAGTR